MPYLHNPFKIRASEHFGPDSTELELRLFGPQILTNDQLKNRTILERLIFIRSSPGGGKTTLLRLFTPTSLLTLHRLQDSDEFRELWKSMKEMGAIDEYGPKVIGVYLRFTLIYPSLEDLDIDNTKKTRFLFSLLNARIIISTLRSLSKIKKLDFPKDLNRIVFTNSNEIREFNSFSNLPGDFLFNWAMEIENSISKLLDSFSPEFDSDIFGHENIIVDLLHQSNIFIDGSPINEKIILLFDDVNKLSKRQRKTFTDFFTEHRPRCGVWLSERNQALDFENMINDISDVIIDEKTFGPLKSYIIDKKYNKSELISVSKMGRDYENVVQLEKIWKPKNFEKNVMNIANRRLAEADDLKIFHFENLLENPLNNNDVIYSESLTILTERIRNRIGNFSKYEKFIEEINNKYTTSREKAISWRKLEIIIERDIGKKQQTLTELDFSQEELEKMDDPSIKSMAEFYLANEFSLPYYFGQETLSQLAHFNIEQFLSISSDIFEEVRGKYRIKGEASLAPKEQHKIIKKSANKKWDEIVNGMSYTNETKFFLEGMGRFLRKETNNPKASYLSVTGVGIKINDIKLLNNSDTYIKLKYTLESCLANNLLEAREINQGGSKKIVFNLNRLLCVYFNLPLQYGGWRTKKLYDLKVWMEGNY